MERQEKQEVEVLQLLVDGRRQMIRTLVERLDQEEERMGRNSSPEA